MRRHLEQQHAVRWAAYKQLSDEHKRRFFPANVAISTHPRAAQDAAEEATDANEPLALQAVAELNAAVVTAIKRTSSMLLDRDIVDELRRDFGADDDFDAFEMQEMETETDDEEFELDVDENEARYVVTVGSKLEFETCVKFVAGGVSFKQAAELYKGMVDGIAGLDQIAGGYTPMTEKKVAGLCQVACAVNLQTLRDVLSRDVWAFALVLEYGKCAGSPFLDVRVRFELDGEIHSVHLIGIVIQEVEVGGDSGELVVRYLDLVAPDYKTQLIGVSCSNEGGTKVRACSQEIISRLAADCDVPIFGDYCLAFKLNQLMREACRVILTANFMMTFMCLLSRLRGHPSHISNMEKCPKFVEGSWRSSVKTLEWLVANQVHVLEFIEQHQYAGAPGSEWWVIALVVTNVATRVSSISQQLRSGKDHSQDRQHLVDLMNHLSMMTGAVGPFLASEFFSISCEDIVIGSFSFNPVATATFLKSQGNLASSTIDSLQPNTYQALVDVTSTFVLTVLSRLNRIIADTSNDANGSNNLTVNNVPSFLPNILCKMRHQDFVGIMQQQRVRLEKRFSSEKIERIEAQHRGLRNAYLLKKTVQEELDRLPVFGSFSDVWREARFEGIDYRDLRSFCGPLAAVSLDASPRTTDWQFTLVNWRKVPFSHEFTDFGLEAILHAQDYSSLSCIRKN
ncbi:unnamed protein product [Phytophthora lilii]|uniref:Unnamed protein product n=1 Tax=Phytophthora lilii TaxID=2077276 RepID=A0A9W6UBE0_9STRA|nr:unnamed protein product [Phytophthora lilii]